MEQIDYIFRNDTISNNIKGDFYLSLYKTKKNDLVKYIEQKYFYEIFKFLKEKREKIIAFHTDEQYESLLDEDIILTKYNELNNKISEDIIDTFLISFIPYIYSRL